MEAIWKIGASAAGYSSLKNDTDADVVVIGAGITGLSAALQLAEDGKRVVVLEALRVGEGCTGGSTGNLYSTVAKGLAPLRRKWGDAVIHDVVAARAQAIDRMETTVERFGIDCQFHRRSLYRLLASDDEASVEALDQERDALRSAGLTVGLVGDVALPFTFRHGLKLDDQAQFNPLHYVLGLARAASEVGVVIHEHSPVREVDYDHNVVKTDAAKLNAEHVVIATHTPKGINMLQTGMIASREYAVSAKLNAPPYPDGIFWMLDPFHSLRSYRYANEDYLMVIGEKHKTGEGELGSGYYQTLRAYLHSHFDVRDVTHCWSAQQYSSADGLPYIGRVHGKKSAYLATGFAADGLTWGALAGMIIGDLIMERDNPWHQRFDARRFTPGKSIKDWSKENVSVAKHFLHDYLGSHQLKQLDEVGIGEGKLVTLDGEKLAVYRTQDGELSVLSAVCPHLKCLVHWNAADTTWDCPCHGSRFDTQGAVIEGPAYHPLARRDRPS